MADITTFASCGRFGQFTSLHTLRRRPQLPNICGYTLGMRLCWLVFCLSLLCSVPGGSAEAETISVPETVATLVRPMLDLLQESIVECGERGKPSSCTDGERYVHERERTRKFEGAVRRLTKERGRSSDEALVVLICYNIGESQEETDAVIKRGQRMLPYLQKYRDQIPIIPSRQYPDSMLHNPANKIENFEGAMRAIRNHWKSTADNPEG